MPYRAGSDVCRPLFVAKTFPEKRLQIVFISHRLAAGSDMRCLQPLCCQTFHKSSLALKLKNTQVHIDYCLALEAELIISTKLVYKTYSYFF